MTGRAARSSPRDMLHHVRRPELLLVALFVVSRVLLHQAGVAIEHVPVDGTWQLIQAELLRERLLESLFYLHSQPPLYNLLIGVLLALFDDQADVALALDVLYAGLGLLLVLLVYRLLRLLGTAPGLGFAAAALFTLSPAAMLYENYAFYTHPAAVLLCLCAVLFAQTVLAFSFRRALALFIAMAALVYLRALFQIQWFVVLAAVLLWLTPGHRRVVLLAAAVPLVLVAALYGKNAYLTGHAGTSSWLGMSLAKATTMQLPLGEREHLVAAGVLSPLALQAPFSVPERYPALFAAVPATGVSVLDRTRKTRGRANFNHRAYPAISRQYLDDALTVIRLRPAVYLESVAVAHLMYFRPSADYPFLEPKRERIAPLVRAYNLAIAGQPVYTDTLNFELGGPGEIGYFIVAGFLICAVFGAAAAWRCLCGSDLQIANLRRGSDLPIVNPGPRSHHHAHTITFLWLNILYVTVVGNALELDENQRFRVLINPLLTVMLTVAATRVWRSPLVRSGACRLAGLAKGAGDAGKAEAG